MAEMWKKWKVGIFKRNFYPIDDKSMEQIWLYVFLREFSWVSEYQIRLFFSRGTEGELTKAEGLSIQNDKE